MYTFVTNIGLKLVIVYLVGNSILKLDLAPVFFTKERGIIKWAGSASRSIGNVSRLALVGAWVMCPD